MTALKRFDNFSRDRYYYNEITGNIYISATSVCSRVLPESPFLTKWKQELGFFEANRRAKESADYGTLLHTLIEDFLLAKELDWQRIHHIIEDNYLPKYQHLHTTWITKLKNDLLSFAQFAYDKDIELIDSEKRLCMDITSDGGIAGTRDIKAWISFNKGRRVAIIDIKSGRKGFYAAHELQLQLYKLMDGNPDIMLFNWSPKKWKLKPTYNFVNQTNTTMAKKVHHYLELMEIDGMFNFSNIKFQEFDKISLGKEPEFEVKGLKEMILSSRED